VAADLFGFSQEVVLSLAGLMHEKPGWNSHPILLFDYAAYKQEAETRHNLIVLRLMQGYIDQFKHMLPEFKELFFSNREELGAHFMAAQPFNGSYDSSALHRSIVVLSSNGFLREQKGFDVETFGRKIIQAGGALITHQSSAEMYRRLGIKTEDGEKKRRQPLLALPFCGHPFSREVENLFVQCRARTNLLVHGRRKEMDDFAGGMRFKGINTLVPVPGEEVVL